MTDIIFPKKQVGEYLNKNFVNIKIDMEKGEGVEIAKKYNIRAYPTFLILDSQGNEINRVVGSHYVDEFIDKIKKALDPSTSPKAKKTAYKNNKTLSNAFAYLEVAENAFFNKDIKEFIEEIFPTLSSEDKFSEKLWTYLALNISDPWSVVFNTLIDNKAEADNILTRERVDRALKSGLINYAMLYVSGKLKDINTNEVFSKLNLLPYMSGNDPEIPFIHKIAKLYNEEKIKEIESLLHIRTLGRMSDASRGLIEKMIFSIEEISYETKLKYNNAKIDYYNSIVARIKAEMEKPQK